MTMENQDKISNGTLSEITNEIEEQKIISLNRFIFLYLITMGLYQIWWIYKAWRFFQQKEKLDINPAARTIFSIFFLYSLFKRIFDFSREKGYQNNYSSIALYFGVIVGNLLSKLPNPYWLISILSFIFFIPPYNALNYAKQHSNDFVVIEQTSFNGRQTGVIVFGIILWLLAILGLIVEKA